MQPYMHQTHIKHTLPPTALRHMGVLLRAQSAAGAGSSLRRGGYDSPGRGTERTAAPTLPRTPRKIRAHSPCLKFCAFQRNCTFQNPTVRWATGSARVSHHSLSGACPGHSACLGLCSAPCQRVTRRNTRALPCPRAQVVRWGPDRASQGPRASSGAAPTPVGNGIPGNARGQNPPGPLRAEIRDITVPSERVRDRKSVV